MSRKCLMFPLMPQQNELGPWHLHWKWAICRWSCSLEYFIAGRNWISCFINKRTCVWCQARSMINLRSFYAECSQVANIMLEFYISANSNMFQSVRAICAMSTFLLHVSSRFDITSEWDDFHARRWRGEAPCEALWDGFQVRACCFGWRFIIFKPLDTFYGGAWIISSNVYGDRSQNIIFSEAYPRGFSA